MINRKILNLAILTFLQTCLIAQNLILGGGNSPQITTRSSSNWQQARWVDSASSDNTINGVGLNGKLIEASRFLYQATLGSNKSEIERTANMGFEAWIDEQMKIKPTNCLSEFNRVIKEVVDWHYSIGGDSADVPNYFYSVYFNYTWWDMNLKNRDELRQRIALALSEIFVVSANSDIGGWGNAMSSYYDVLIKNAFGNFYNLLHDITYHPAMGIYLSHLNNPKTNVSENIRPDENYAREIMQLFTIGLFELNKDGTLKKDNNGNAIPTYSQKDIQELAKVFTGLSFGKLRMNPSGGSLDSIFFPNSLYLGDPTYPMVMFDSVYDWSGRKILGPHEPGTKTLFGKYTTTWPQSGDEDIAEALQLLFNHPNVPPFICKQLIQRLIKSNPSPAYVSRIADVFINDGNGVRGNMAAVIKAILLDEEARTCEWLEDEFNGQLRPPMMKYSHFVNAIGVEQYYNRFFNASYDFLENTNQIPLHAPSVFNFYSPAFQPKGEITKNDLVAPEFQIFNSRTSIGFMNQVNNWIYDYVLYSWMDQDPYTVLLIDELKNLSRDPEVLINRLDVLFTHGQMSETTRKIIKNVISKFVTGDYRNERVRCALYLVIISPDYAIFK